VKLVGPFTTTLEMTDSSEATVELDWVRPRWMFCSTDVAVSGVPSENFRPGRSVNVTLLPSAAYFHDDARPGWTSPLAFSVVTDAYTRPSTCMSQPAEDVTGSHEVGSSHSQLSVPLAPSAAAPATAAADPPGEPLPQAASAVMPAMDAATAAIR
jgi:hypothetical protein